MSEGKQPRPWWSSVGGGRRRKVGGGGRSRKAPTLKGTRNEGRCLLCQYNYANVKKIVQIGLFASFVWFSGLSVSLCNRNTF